MKQSKYVGKQFGNWICTDIGIANAQGKKAKAPGRLNYYYMMERVTSDGKCEKIIRLNSTEAAKVYQNKATVEQILERRESSVDLAPSREIAYKFI